LVNHSKRLLFVCPDIQKPSGGIKQIYRQVDVLNKNGFEAYILHDNPGFKCNWFANKTPVLYNPSLFKDLVEFFIISSNSKSPLHEPMLICSDGYSFGIKT